VHSRGVRINLETVEEIHGFAGRRGLPEWVRSAVKFASENAIAPERIRDEAAELALQRRGCPAKTIAVALGQVLLAAVRDYGARVQINDKEVLEGCANLYLKVHRAWVRNQSGMGLGEKSPQEI